MKSGSIQHLAPVLQISFIAIPFALIAQRPIASFMPLLISRLFSPQLLRPLFWLLFAFALTMAVLPKPPQLPIDHLGDKFAHMLAFASLTLVAGLAWRTTAPWLIALRLSLFGVAIELVQMVPVLHRDADWRDWAADSIAIALAMLIAQFLIRIMPLDEIT